MDDSSEPRWAYEDPAKSESPGQPDNPGQPNYSGDLASQNPVDGDRRLLSDSEAGIGRGLGSNRLRPARPTDPEVVAAVRTMRLLAVALVVLVAGTAVFIGTRLARNNDTTPAPSPVPASTSPAAPVIEADPADDGIGPLPGADVDTYLTSRADYLAGLVGGSRSDDPVIGGGAAPRPTGVVASGAEERTAVVSLESYSPEAGARRQVAGLRVVGLLVAKPGTPPASVTEPLTQWVQQQKSRDRAERDELRRLLPTVDDPAFKADYEAELARLEASLANLDAQDELVFALVVRGTLSKLAALADDSEVRLVDVAESERETTAESILRGLRPEEKTKANTPPVRPRVAAPTPTSRPSTAPPTTSPGATGLTSTTAPTSGNVA
ncbi:MAG: hypothetical protein ACT4OS_02075 [Acidimicrobiales bacterium]